MTHNEGTRLPGPEDADDDDVTGHSVFLGNADLGGLAREHDRDMHRDVEDEKRAKSSRDGGRPRSFLDRIRGR